MSSDSTTTWSRRPGRSVLIVVPPSESKRPPEATGAPVDIERLSFPQLAPTRREVAEALIRTSASLDAFARLQVRPTLAREVARNTHLLELPAVPVLDLYTGPLHDGLDAARLSRAGAARAEQQVVVTSALWGALRPADRIPPYRMHICSHLVGMGGLAAAWRKALPIALADAAGDGLVIDVRSPVYQAAGLAAVDGDRIVILRVDLGPSGHRIGDVIAKRVRGEAAHHLLESGADPGDAQELADVLANRWPVRLAEPDRPGKAWTMTVSVEA
jgi:cytoplasmic iron level regulating protein YaaA (DUF328/UPF0246 family)